MYILENDFILKLVKDELDFYSANGVSCFDFKNFLNNLPPDLINDLPNSSKHILGYYFNSYDYQLFETDFYNCYSFVSSFENEYSLFDEE